jgi:hypothetical protein
MGVALVLLVIEFVADKIQFVDSIWDVIMFRRGIVVANEVLPQKSESSSLVSEFSSDVPTGLRPSAQGCRFGYPGN